MTHIPDAAVQAALDEWFDGYDTGDKGIFDDMRSALTAALHHLPLGFEVKQLEWANLCEYGLEYRVKTSIGTYSIHTDEDSDGGRMFCYFHLTDDADCTKYGEEIYSGYDDDDTIKAAAQADLDRRVHECIVAKPVDVAAVRRQAFDEAVLVAETKPMR